jgi:integrase
VPAVLAGFTFHEGRHTHRTWLADDGITDVARAARLGHNLPGMADVYEHVTPAMKQRVT